MLHQRLKSTREPPSEPLTYDQKQGLSAAIANVVDGETLNKAIQIIQEGVPEIQGDAGDIELDIDLIPNPTLTKLYNFVVRGDLTEKPKKSSHGDTVTPEKTPVITRMENEMVRRVSGGNVLTIKQKRELCDAVAELDGQDLDEAILIIQEAIPSIRNYTDEIELEMDLIPTSVLKKLYTFIQGRKFRDN
ncbi:hypothetical protein C8R43DRAFT_959215 [Mycena crocata]|nr:hypothetical protein C8R43DRAFT_959215 [Mycena crocata]